ncbi:response regulator transcription factor [Granulosicoccus sp. 3-233]|uniref:response regulator transcription factor n=1 Tax=Granulosicoccus sp. 3-233 TaxID=3417969 RepID=UPI003D34302C
MSNDGMESDGGFTLLLVDDDHDVLAANARFLRLQGIQVVLADSADTALLRLESERVDAIITDLCMPERSGLEFAADARIRRPLVPIVFFSGLASVADVVAAMRLGAVDFLEKPVEPQDMLATVLTLRDRYEGVINNQRLSFDLADETVPFRYRVLAYEKLLIEQSLSMHDGQVGAVIDQLQINRRTLNDKMRRLGIVRPIHD